MDVHLQNQPHPLMGHLYTATCLFSGVLASIFTDLELSIRLAGAIGAIVSMFFTVRHYIIVTKKAMIEKELLTYQLEKLKKALAEKPAAA